jgi:hypothetical protein
MAPGTTAPDWSDTRPLSEELCANNMGTIMALTQTATKKLRKIPVSGLTLKKP